MTPEEEVVVSVDLGTAPYTTEFAISSPGNAYGYAPLNHAEFQEVPQEEIQEALEVEGAVKSKGKKKSEPDAGFVNIHSKMGVDFLLDKKSLDIFVRADDYQVQIDKVKMNELKDRLNKSNGLSLKLGKIKTMRNEWNMGDRVFLYGPTGTGKTYSVLDWFNSKGIKHQMVTVSDGFEDMDFLTYIFPSAKGIQYKEKAIVQLLRDAAAGEKVGILIDEANRGSKSFMNFLLKMIDPVTDVYEINNFVADEIIKIPKENIIWLCTANLGGGYSGANDLDEALLDRFNKVSFVGYNQDFENMLYDAFGTHAKEVRMLVEYIRKLFNDNALKRPISSRSLKVWAEEFINTPKSPTDVFAAFERTVMYRLVSVDSYGFPVKDTEALILSKFIELGFISK